MARSNSARLDPGEARTPFHVRYAFVALAGVALLAAAIAGCAAESPEEGQKPIVSDQFAGGLLQVARVAGGSHGEASFVAIDPDLGDITTLSWPPIDTVDDEGSPCLARGGGIRWTEGDGDGRLFVNLPFGCVPGPYWVAADGSTSAVGLVAAALPLADMTPQDPIQPFGHQASTDGEQIVYAVTTMDVDNQPYEDLFVAAASGGPERQVTRLPPGIIPSFAWLPDGRTIVVAHRPFDGGDARLYRVNADTQSISPIIDPRQPPPFVSEEGALEGPIVVDPRGDRLAFVSAGRLWLLDLGDANAERVDVPPAEGEQSGVSALAWSPDGSQLAFASDHEGVCERAGNESARPGADEVNGATPPCTTFLYVYSIDEQRFWPITTLAQSRPLGLTWAPAVAPAE